jgi:hypothetical protein
MHLRPSGRHLLVCASILLLIGNCAIYNPMSVRPLSPAQPVQVKTPVKAHLADGSTVIFYDGATVANGKIAGKGTRYDIRLQTVGTVDELPLADVAAFETFEESMNRSATVLATSATSIGVVLGTVALLKLLFGSCPTVYADVDGHQVLEAELFSYSIAPLFEVTDVDPLRARAGADGKVVLDVRNEALETHYLNHLELLAVAHEPGEIVVPDENGLPLALSDFRAPRTIVDRTGRDLRQTVESLDDRVYRTDEATLARATKRDLRDWIELEIPAPADRHEVAVLMTLRNSLLNTILFYDTMLRAAGPKSLNWLARDLNDLRPAYALGSWYATDMGMRVEVWRDGAFAEVTHAGDTGPIAWKDMAVTVPVPPHESAVRIRVSFPADNWRIDQLRVAANVRKPLPRTIPIGHIIGSDGARDMGAVQSLTAADTRYLKTSPGESFRVVFDAAPAPAETTQTFLLRSRGYYTEWIRGSWVATATPEVFTPGESALFAAIQHWRNVQADFERQFYAARIPVR